MIVQWQIEASIHYQHIRTARGLDGPRQQKYRQILSLQLNILDPAPMRTLATLLRPSSQFPSTRQYSLDRLAMKDVLSGRVDFNHRGQAPTFLPVISAM